jgi:hypothetical protein
MWIGKKLRSDEQSLAIFWIELQILGDIVPLQATSHRKHSASKDRDETNYDGHNPVAHRQRTSHGNDGHRQNDDRRCRDAEGFEHAQAAHAQFRAIEKLGEREFHRRIAHNPLFSFPVTSPYHFIDT